MIRFLCVATIFTFAAMLAPGLLFAVAFLAIYRWVR